MSLSHPEEINIGPNGGSNRGPDAKRSCTPLLDVLRAIAVRIIRWRVRILLSWEEALKSNSEVDDEEVSDLTDPSLNSRDVVVLRFEI